MSDQPGDLWSKRWASLAELKGNAAEEEAERLDALWRAEYEAAFVARAKAQGWKGEDGTDLGLCCWASDMSGDALVSCRGKGDASPAEVAEIDVIESEWETSFA